MNKQYHKEYSKKYKEKNKLLHTEEFYRLLFASDKEKLCGKCKESKSVNEFHKNGGVKDGLADQCKECKLKVRRDFYLNNKEAILKQQDGYRRDHKEESNERARKLRGKNPEKYNKKARESYSKNKKKIIEQKKIRYFALGGYSHIAERVKKHRDKNKVYINEKQKEYRNNNLESYHERDRRYYAENKEKIDEQIKIRNEKRGCTHSHAMMLKLSDGYVRATLAGNGLSAKDIPVELIELKREQLKVMRYLRENADLTIDT